MQLKNVPNVALLCVFVLWLIAGVSFLPADVQAEPSSVLESCFTGILCPGSIGACLCNATVRDEFCGPYGIACWRSGACRGINTVTGVVCFCDPTGCNG